jgi:hypothetical protein
MMRLMVKKRDDAALKSEIGAALLAKGVRLNIGGCGCCGSPQVSVEIDGELLLDSEYDFNLTMIPDSA